MSWEQLSSIRAEQAEANRAEREDPPDYCPNDATLLQQGPRDELHCPFDGWIWDGQPV